MPKVFFQLLNWIVFIIWLAVGWVLYYLGLPYFLGIFLTFVVFIIWFISWVYVQFGALSYITPLSTFIIIAVGIGVIYLFWNKRKK